MTEETAQRLYGAAAAYVLAQRRLKRKLHWEKAYENIKSRCGNPRATGYKHYGGKGIKCLLTVQDLRAAFLRDSAHRLKVPSVDRIDSNGHYTPENIRWIEFSENRARTEHHEGLRRPYGPKNPAKRVAWLKQRATGP